MLTLLLCLSAHAADSQHLVYEVTLGDRAVGERSVEITTLPGDEAESRLLQSVVRVELGPGVVLQQRLSGRGTDRLEGFAAVNASPDGSWEVQAARVPDGFRVSYADQRGLQQETVRARSVQSTSLSLLDPQGPGLQEGPHSLLSAETGELVSGVVERVGETTLTLGGQAVPATEYLWHSELGEQRLAYGADGTLLRYSAPLLGQDLVFTLTEAPVQSGLQLEIATPVIQEEEL